MPSGYRRSGPPDFLGRSRTPHPHFQGGLARLATLLTVVVGNMVKPG